MANNIIVNRKYDNNDMCDIIDAEQSRLISQIDAIWKESGSILTMSDLDLADGAELKRRVDALSKAYNRYLN